MQFKLKLLLSLFLLFVINIVQSQSNNFLNIDSIKPQKNYDNIFVKPIYTDSLEVSSFLIFIKKEVKSHKHLLHAEHVFIMEGEGIMQLGEQIKAIKKGDFIFIPKNTFHAVKTTSEIPLKVISLQAPFFDGTDRILKQE